MVPLNVAPGKSVIFLRIGSVTDIPNKVGSYSLQINSTSVTIVGPDSSGVFYAVQSLLSLADTAVAGEVPLCIIKDSPRFEHRGQHIDVSRNFHTVDDLKRLMEAMALYKMNRLHIHMGDDEGWRLEIPGISELTQVGLGFICDQHIGLPSVLQSREIVKLNSNKRCSYHRFFIRCF